jgi:hypothetical protein
METKNSNYIYLPLIGLFASILAFLILGEDRDSSKLIPYGFLFLLSVVDVYREKSDGNDGSLFGGYDDGIDVNGYNDNNHYRHYNNDYRNYNNDYRNYNNNRKTNVIVKDKDLVDKVRQTLAKSKLVKLYKEETNKK